MGISGLGGSHAGGSGGFEKWQSLANSSIFQNNRPRRHLPDCARFLEVECFNPPFVCGGSPRIFSEVPRGFALGRLVQMTTTFDTDVFRYFFSR